MVAGPILPAKIRRAAEAVNVTRDLKLVTSLKVAHLLTIVHLIPVEIMRTVSMGICLPHVSARSTTTTLLAHARRPITVKLPTPATIIKTVSQYLEIFDVTVTTVGLKFKMARARTRTSA